MDRDEITELVRRMIEEDSKGRLSPSELVSLRQLIHDQARIMENLESVRELRDAFLKPPLGSDTSLIQELRDSNAFYRKVSSMSRSLIWIIPTLAVFVTSWETIKKWITVFFSAG